ncbi:MAG: rhodanese-like domain-containing protein [Myxococcota bacterium]
MYFSEKQAGDVSLHINGIEVFVSAASTHRADGMIVDAVETPNGPAFKIDNPNAPAQAKQMTVSELKSKQDAGEAFELFDVRGDEERQIASIPGDRPLDEAAQKHIASLPKDTMLIFYCHTGIRSQSAVKHYVSEGYTAVYNLVGGVEAWSQEIDPQVPRY